MLTIRTLIAALDSCDPLTPIRFCDGSQPDLSELPLTRPLLPRSLVIAQGHGLDVTAGDLLIYLRRAVGTVLCDLSGQRARRCAPSFVVAVDDDPLSDVIADRLEDLGDEAVIMLDEI